MPFGAFSCLHPPHRLRKILDHENYFLLRLFHLARQIKNRWLSCLRFGGFFTRFSKVKEMGVWDGCEIGILWSFFDSLSCRLFRFHRVSLPISHFSTSMVWSWNNFSLSIYFLSWFPLSIESLAPLFNSTFPFGSLSFDVKKHSRKYFRSWLFFVLTM